jgi:taurine dioxygenase
MPLAEMFSTYDWFTSCRDTETLVANYDLAGADTRMNTLTEARREAAEFSARLPFDVRLTSPLIGAEVVGVNLGEPVSETVGQSLRTLLWDRGVLFFHDQHLSPERQIVATSVFGPPKTGGDYRQGSPHPGIGVVDSINEISGRVSRWHADLTSNAAPPTVRLLHAIELPEIGGDTLWASTEAAYERLSEPLKRLAESLTAIHAITPISWSQFDERRTRFHWSEHPLVREHPVTGRKALFVNPRFTQEIVGLRPHESAAVLKVFFDHITRPEHQVRFQWRQGSLAVWDNRSTVHYASDDYGAERRIMYSSEVDPGPASALSEGGPA